MVSHLKESAVVQAFRGSCVFGKGLTTDRLHDFFIDAIGHDDEKAVLKFIKKYPQVLNSSYKQFGTPLTWAIGLKKKKMAELLLDNGADINQRNHNGATPVVMAAINGAADILDMLSERGADLSKLAADGKTPEVAAAAYGQDDQAAHIVQLKKNHRHEKTNFKRGLKTGLIVNRRSNLNKGLSDGYTL